MTRHAEFSRTRQQGQAKGGAYLVLSTLADDQLPHHLAGVIITKKVGNAVTRNLLRRRFRSYVQQHVPDFVDQKRYLVTIARPTAKNASNAELEADWVKQARRLGLFEPSR